MDGLLTLAEAAKLFPDRVSTGAIWRWARRGVKARNGEHIFLRSERYGKRIYTRAEWVQEFGRKLAEADKQIVIDIEPPGRPKLLPHDLAVAALEEAGL